MTRYYLLIANPFISDTSSFEKVLENFACISMTGASSVDCPPMYLIPSQIPSEDSPFIFRMNMSSLDPAGRNCSAVAVRDLLSVLPTKILSSSRDVTRKIKANVDNTLFLYPLTFDKFKGRYNGH